MGKGKPDREDIIQKGLDAVWLELQGMAGYRETEENWLGDAILDFKREMAGWTLRPIDACLVLEETLRSVVYGLLEEEREELRERKARKARRPKKV